MSEIQTPPHDLSAMPLFAIVPEPFSWFLAFLLTAALVIWYFLLFKKQPIRSNEGFRDIINREFANLKAAENVTVSEIDRLTALTRTLASELSNSLEAPSGEFDNRPTLAVELGEKLALIDQIRFASPKTFAVNLAVAIKTLRSLEETLQEAALKRSQSSPSSLLSRLRGISNE